MIVLSYNGGPGIEDTLEALCSQRIDEPFEVVVVHSGADDTAARIACSYDGVRVVRSPKRLLPGAARNAGVRAARGGYVAFLPHDGVPDQGWLAARLARHRDGFDIVGGSVAPGRTLGAVALADYIIDFSGAMPSERVLARQVVPHCLSYARSLFDRFGFFPEDLEAGEDTVFNARLLHAGVAVAFAPDATYRVEPPASLQSFVRHQVGHGRAAMRSTERYGLDTRTGSRDQSRARAAYRILARHVARKWAGILSRLALSRDARLLAVALVSPVVWVGIAARAWGMWSEWRAHRRTVDSGPHSAATRVAAGVERTGL